MKDITVIGGGGHCFALVELIRSGGLFRVVKVVDKMPKAKTILDVPMYESTGKEIEDTHVAIAIGDNKIRKIIAENLTTNCPNFIHDSAVCYPSAQFGKGIQVLPNAVIDADVSIGDFSIINNNATVSHNSKISAFCHVAIGAAISGGCTIGEGVLVGARSVILPNISVGKWATIGAGAVVTKDVPSGATVVGNPAKIIKTNHE